MHAGACVNHGPLRFRQHGRGAFQINRIGTIARGRNRVIGQRFRHFLIPHIGRDFDQHGTATAVAQPREGTAQNIRHLSRAHDGLGRFGDAAHLHGRIEIRVNMRNAARITHGQHQHRHAFAIALRHTAIGILGAWAMLHAEGANGAARCHARNGIRHVQADSLLPHHDGADIGIRRIFDQMLDRIAGEDLNPLTLHDFRNGRAEFHTGLPLPWRQAPFHPLARSRCLRGKPRLALCPDAIR